MVRHPRVNLVSNNSSISGITGMVPSKEEKIYKHFCYQVSMNGELEKHAWILDSIRGI
jgi:hypothetical protein